MRSEAIIHPQAGFCKRLHFGAILGHTARQRIEETRLREKSTRIEEGNYRDLIAICFSSGVIWFQSISRSRCRRVLSRSL